MTGKDEVNIRAFADALSTAISRIELSNKCSRRSRTKDDLHLSVKSLHGCYTGPWSASSRKGTGPLVSSMVWALTEQVGGAHQALGDIALAWEHKGDEPSDECAQLRRLFGQVRSLREACDAVLDLEASVQSRWPAGEDTSSTGSWSEDEAEAGGAEPQDSFPVSVQDSFEHASENEDGHDAPVLASRGGRGAVPALNLSGITSDCSPMADIGSPTNGGTPRTRHLSFCTSCSYTRVGQHLRVVGSCDSLGAWNPLQGLALKTTAEDFPLWNSAGTLALAEDAVVEYKYVVCDQSGAAVCWEARPNRVLHVASAMAAAGHQGSRLVVMEAFEAASEEGGERFCSSARAGPAKAVALCTPRMPLCEPPIFTPTTRRHQPSAAPGGLLQVPAIPPLQLVREDSCSQLFERIGGKGAGAPGCAFRTRYELLGDGPLAEGGFGLVWRCCQRAAQIRGQEFAAKIINKQVMARDHSKNIQLYDEVLLHSELKHPNIVSLVEYFDEGSTLTLVLELCCGGDLFDSINAARAKRPEGGLHEPGAAAAGRDLLRALEYLHGRSLVHRDVKCENVLVVHRDAPLEQNAFKLCDFGFAARSCDAGLCGRVGSPDTVAPEVVAGKPYGCPADLWSAGVVLYMALVAEPPFAGTTDTQVLQRVVSGSYSLQGGSWGSISGAATRLVESLMTVSVALRPSAAQALQSEWLQIDPPHKARGPGLCRRERSGSASMIADLLSSRFSWTASKDR